MACPLRRYTCAQAPGVPLYIIEVYQWYSIKLVSRLAAFAARAAPALSRLRLPGPPCAETLCQYAPTAGAAPAGLGPRSAPSPPGAYLLLRARI